MAKFLQLSNSDYGKFAFLVLFIGIFLSFTPVFSDKVFALPPETTLLSTQSDPSNDTTPTFTFESDQVDSTFECQIDSEPYAPCVSPITYPALLNGSHTFSVRATNLLTETDLTSATQTWTIVAFAGGDGSPGDPYQVNSCDQLQAMSYDLSAAYALVGDVDCDGYAFAAIGSVGTDFTGTFNGNGYKIQNITISGGSDQGIFGSTDSATIENVEVESASVTGTSNIGALIGVATYTSISDVKVSSSTITASGSAAGGIVGQLGGSLISRGEFRGTVVSTSNRVGGLAGYVVGPSGVSDSLARTAIQGSATVGGLIGEVGIGPMLTIANSYAISTFTALSGSDSGLIAVQDSGTIVTNNFHVSNLAADAGIVAENYLNTSTYGPLASWSFGPSNTWHVNYNDYPSLTPLNDPYILCEAPILGFSSLDAACDIGNYGWGTTTWEVEYQETGDTGWQAITLDDTKVFDVTVNGPRGDKNYTVRFRFTNDFGTSSWSTIDYVAFADGDDDLDGTSNYYEWQGPNNGDANNDGEQDSMQPEVYSTQNPVSNNYTVLTTTCQDNFNVQIGAEPQDSQQTDANYSYPAGLIAFVGRNCGAPGSSVVVTIDFYGNYQAKNSILRKYDSSDGTYKTVEGATFTNLTIGSQEVLRATYTIVDGGPLDDDNTADGNIVDPVGLSVVPTAANTGVLGSSIITSIASTGAGMSLVSAALIERKLLNRLTRKQ